MAGEVKTRERERGSDGTGEIGHAIQRLNDPSAVFSNRGFRAAVIGYPKVFDVVKGRCGTLAWRDRLNAVFRHPKGRLIGKGFILSYIEPT